MNSRDYSLNRFCRFHFISMCVGAIFAVWLLEPVMPTATAGESKDVTVSWNDGKTEEIPLNLHFNGPTDTCTVNVTAQANYVFAYDEWTFPKGLPDTVTVKPVAGAKGKTSWTFTFTFVGASIDKTEETVYVHNALVPAVGGGGGGKPKEFDLKALLEFVYCRLETKEAQPKEIKELIMGVGTTTNVVGRMISGTGNPTGAKLKLEVPAALGTATPAEATDAGTGKVDYTITAGDEPGGPEDMILSNPTPPSDTQVKAEDFKVKLTIAKADLDANKVSHNSANGELSDDDEETVGAFVPVNNDDDDYDAGNKPDKDQTGAISGEDDLLPILLHKIEPNSLGGKYKLEIPSHLRVWKKEDRTETVDATTEIDAAADTTLYVEGFTDGSDKVKLNWAEGTKALNDCDRIKVTSFKWLGPLNVPGYAIYKYTASGALGSSKWTTPDGGTIKTGANTSDVAILWGEGPSAGKAVYQVNNNYTWDLKVNVVQIKLAPDNDNVISYMEEGPYQNPDDRRVIVSSLDYAMFARLRAEKIAGPVVNGKMRGVKFMEMGFLQNITVESENAEYYAKGNKVKYVRKSKVQGMGKLLDYYTREAEHRSQSPWYDSKLRTGYAFHSFTTDPNAAVSILFTCKDTPSAQATDSLELSTDDGNLNANQFNIRNVFVLHFVVRTRADVNESAQTFTTRAIANTWVFDGTGRLNKQGFWFRLRQTGNGGDTAFSIVANGSEPKVKGGDPINDLLPDPMHPKPGDFSTDKIILK